MPNKPPHTKIEDELHVTNDNEAPAYYPDPEPGEMPPSYDQTIQSIMDEAPPAYSKDDSKKAAPEKMATPPSYQEAIKMPSYTSNVVPQSQLKTTVAGNARTPSPQVLMTISLNNLSKEINEIGKKMESEKSIGGKLKGYGELLNKTLNTMGFIAIKCLGALKTKITNKLTPKKERVVAEEDKNDFRPKFK